MGEGAGGGGMCLIMLRIIFVYIVYIYIYVFVFYASYLIVYKTCTRGGCCHEFDSSLYVLFLPCLFAFELKAGPSPLPCTQEVAQSRG